MANTGPNAKINQTCTVVDSKLFRQFRAIADGTKRNAKLLKDISAQLQTIVDQIEKAGTNVEAGAGSVISMNQNGGITAGQVNIDTHIAPSLTADQQSDLTTRLKPFAGSKVGFWTASPRNDVRIFAEQLVTAMKGASIDANIQGSRTSVGGDLPALSCVVSPNRMELVNALASFLVEKHLISGKLPCQQTMQPDIVDCAISNW